MSMYFISKRLNGTEKGTLNEVENVDLEEALH